MLQLGASDYVAKDDLLTSSVFRSLQATLRESSAASEAQLRGSIGEGDHGLESACAEGAWLLQALSSKGSAAPHADGGFAPEYGSEHWPDTLAQFTKYLLACSERLTVEPMNEESSLVRMLMEQGLSPREVVMLYEAGLRGLRTEENKLQGSPATFLARLLARLVEEYQRQASNAAIERAA